MLDVVHVVDEVDVVDAWILSFLLLSAKNKKAHQSLSNLCKVFDVAPMFAVVFIVHEPQQDTPGHQVRWSTFGQLRTFG